MNKEIPLFRPAALDARRTSTIGEIVLTQPVSFVALTLVAIIAGSVIAGYFVWGDYTQHTTLTGQLIPDPGLVRVHAGQYGTVIEKRVGEGDSIDMGEVLYVISSERRSSALGATHARLGIETRTKLESLEAQIEKLHVLERTDRESLERMLDALTSERRQLRELRRDRSERVELAEQAVARYRRLRGQGFASEEHVVAKRESLLEQRSALQQLERESSSVARQLVDLRSQLSGLALKYANQRAELERAIAGARQELTRNEAERRITVTAPAAGVATAVQGDVGQFVDANSALVSIVPHGAELRAKLYAPSRAVGFMNVSDAVRVRYAAYAYQKFGHYEGTVAAISRAALPVTDGGAEADAASEPMYEVTVELESQTVTAYGEQRLLKAGMTVEADVLQETRRLYEWVLEPLYTLHGKIH